MVVLEVGIDARGAIQGGQQASSAFNGLATAAAFALQQIGQTNASMAALATRVSLFAAGASALGAAFGAIATAVGLMGTRVSETTREWDRLTTSIEKAQRTRQTAAALGVSSLFDAAASQREKQALFEMGVASRSAGATPQTVMQLAARMGGGVNAQQLLDALTAKGIGIASPSQGNWMAEQYQILTTPLNQQQLDTLIGWRADQLGGFFPPLERGNGWMGIPFRPGAAEQSSYSFPADVGSGFYPGLGQGPLIGADHKTAVENQRQDNSRKQAKEDMREIAMLSQEIGSYLGDAAFDFAAGLRSGRDVLASILMDLGRGFSRAAMQQLTSGIINAFGNTK